MYGDIKVIIRKSNGKKTKKNSYLNLDVNGNIKNFDLEWWQDDTFITDKDEKWRERLLVDFEVNNGNVKSLNIYGTKFDKIN